MVALDSKESFEATIETYAVHEVIERIPTVDNDQLEQVYVSLSLIRMIGKKDSELARTYLANARVAAWRACPNGDFFDGYDTQGVLLEYTQILFPGQVDTLRGVEQKIIAASDCLMMSILDIAKEHINSGKDLARKSGVYEHYAQFFDCLEEHI
jgi:hypothetical protein